jgi:hypothetical protein
MQDSGFGFWSSLTDQQLLSIIHSGGYLPSARAFAAQEYSSRSNTHGLSYANQSDDSTIRGIHCISEHSD